MRQRKRVLIEVCPYDNYYVEIVDRKKFFHKWLAGGITVFKNKNAIVCMYTISSDIPMPGKTEIKNIVDKTFEILNISEGGKDEAI